MDEANDAPSLGGPKRGKMHVGQMNVRHTANGGYIAKHEMEDKQGRGGDSREYGLTDGDALLEHVKQHMIDNAPQPVAGSE